MQPKRPFGVSLAIIASTFMLAVMPLMLAGMLLYLNNRVDLPGDGSFSGITFLGISEAAIGVYSAAAAVFLVLAGLAWAGRPAAMRFVFPVAVLLMSLLMLGLLWVSGSTPAPGADSAEGARQGLRSSYLAILALLLLYVVWFFNRWSARAYYRGHYTTEDLKILEDYQQALRKSEAAPPSS